MSLIAVKGSPGSGKTATCELLEFYGFESYDIDRDGLAIARDNITGEVVTDIGNTAEWWDQHAFELDEERILAIKAKAEEENRLVFICGTVGDDSKLWHTFDLNVILQASARAIDYRLANRASRHNNFGKAPEERRLVIERMRAKYDMYRRMGGVIISSEQPPAVVANQVLAFSLALHAQRQATATMQPGA